MTGDGVSHQPQPLIGIAASRHSPARRVWCRPDPSRLAPPERLTPIADRERARWLGPIISLVLHLLPLLLLIEWPFAAPPETEPIAGAAGVRTASVPAASASAARLRRNRSPNRRRRGASPPRTSATPR